ncbi:MAG: signal peptidase II [Defluviitaleaceae bacterium]|nr:signal peptidase II [Defluviitaleaceae bacterium]
MKLIVFLTFLLDQLCKYWINQNLEIGEEWEIIAKKLHITNLKNKGMAMEVFSNKRWIVLLSSVFAIASLIRLWKRTDKFEKLGVAFMAGGGLSNIYDRFAKGEVTDYIFFKQKKGTPVFNLADIFVIIGTVITLITRLSAYCKKNG